MRELSPGAAWRRGTVLPTDVFAFDRHGNLYATTHPFNTVVRLAPEGTRQESADLSTGANAPTAAAFAAHRPGRARRLAALSPVWEAPDESFDIAPRQGAAWNEGSFHHPGPGWAMGNEDALCITSPGRG